MIMIVSPQKGQLYDIGHHLDFHYCYDSCNNNIYYNYNCKHNNHIVPENIGNCIIY
jgi:hypothetical protein